MVWNDLYNKRNQIDEVILPLSWYKSEAEDFQWVNSVEICKSIRLTKDAALGFVIRKPGPEFPSIVDDFKILTASDNDPRTDKIVAIKELMHCCENDVAFNVNSEERLDALFNHFYGRTTEMSSTELFIQSEPIAFWKSLALLTPENNRLLIKEDLEKNPHNESFWASELRVPEFIIDALVGPRFDFEVQTLLAV